RRVEPPAQDISDVARNVLGKMDPGLETTCMAAAVRNVERARPDAVAQGWAAGDVAAAISGPRDFEGCLLLLNGGARIWREITDAHARMIADALKAPGHSVALVDISRLVAEEGIIRRLEARGLSVTGPGGD
ncbi:MAG: TraB/GumN family protein, partial [Phenylobacterium sp.]